MSSPRPADVDQATFWNEDGGRRWVEHIDQLERMLEGMSRVLVEAVAAAPGERVLDVGCGGGPTSAQYAAAVGETGHVLGIDISAVILEVARRRFAEQRNLRFEVADAGTHAFAPGSFDVLTSRFGVMFFPDPPTAFTNLRRALRTGGRLCFMCWRSLDENPWMGAAAAAAFTVIPPPPKPAPGTPGPFSLGRRERVLDILGAAGFADVTLEGVERDITLGDLDQAVDWLTRMGPAAAPLAEAPAAVRDDAIAAMRAELARHQRNGAVTLPGATWLVRARVGG
ncbi:MAG: class I SAM-dependent methyltransferase [Gammaproteobacteria bacterium]